MVAIPLLFAATLAFSLYAIVGTIVDAWKGRNP